MERGKAGDDGASNQPDGEPGSAYMPSLKAPGYPRAAMDTEATVVGKVALFFSERATCHTGVVSEPGAWGLGVVLLLAALWGSVLLRSGDYSANVDPSQATLEIQIPCTVY